MLHEFGDCFIKAGAGILRYAQMMGLRFIAALYTSLNSLAEKTTRDVHLVGEVREQCLYHYFLRVSESMYTLE